MHDDKDQAGIGAKPDGHTVRRFDGEMSQLHIKVLEMGELALAQLRDALQVLKQKDLGLVEALTVRESRIDQLEIEADADVLGIIARRCPMGSDLRMVMASSKAVTDLERIGDEAMRIVGIAQQVYSDGEAGPNEPLLRDVRIMGDFVAEALEQALRAFDVLDEALAEQVLDGEERLEETFEAGLRRLMTFVMEDVRNIGFAVNMILVIKALERIGAHAQNLAEYVVFQVEGHDIRHQAA